MIILYGSGQDLTERASTPRTPLVVPLASSHFLSNLIGATGSFLFAWTPPPLLSTLPPPPCAVWLSCCGEVLGPSSHFWLSFITCSACVKIVGSNLKHCLKSSIIVGAHGQSHKSVVYYSVLTLINLMSMRSWVFLEKSG